MCLSNPPQQLSQRAAGFALLAPKAVSIGLRNCPVARFGQALKPSKASQQLSKASAPHNPLQQLSKRPAGFAMVPPCAFLLALQAVSIGLRNCRVARFGQALKPSKASQQLSKASAPHNPPQQLSKRPAGFAMVPPCAFLSAAAAACPIGPKSCFYWASKLPRGTFWAGLKTFKSLAAAFEGLSTAQPSAAALEASCWLCHGASMCLSIGPTSCFYWASKLPRGTFWAGLKTFKSLAAAFEGLSTAQPSAAALEVCCWFCHGASLLAPKAVSIGLRNCRVARFGQALKPSKASQQLSKASAPHNPPQQLSKCVAGFAMVPPYWPQKLFLLGFETAAWHVLGRP